MRSVTVRKKIEYSLKAHVNMALSKMRLSIITKKNSHGTTQAMVWSTNERAAVSPYRGGLQSVNDADKVRAQKPGVPCLSRAVFDSSVLIGVRVPSHEGRRGQC